MEYTIPFEDQIPARWRRAHDELSPPSSPAVVDSKPAAHYRPRLPAKHGEYVPSTAVKPAQGRAPKTLTPPTSTESARTTAVRPLDPVVVKAACAAARDEDARDGDRSSSSSPVPRSSPTPAGPESSSLPLPGTVTPPPSHRHQLPKRRAAAIPPPIRDTPNNPFIEGGPADLGFRGPFGHDAKRVAANRAANRVQRGRTTYVFRGQRITYDDPDYFSGDSDSDGLFGPNGLQPRLLFPADTPPRASSSASSRSRARIEAADSSARLQAYLTARERELTSAGARFEPAASSSKAGVTHRDEKGIDIDSYFGPSEPLARPAGQGTANRTVVHADANHLLQRCDDWSSDMSEDDAAHHHPRQAHYAHHGLDRLRMDMDHLVAVGEHPPATGSIAMSRRTSSRSSSASSRSAAHSVAPSASAASAQRSSRLIPGGAGQKRKAHPLWNRDVEMERRNASVGTEDAASDSTGHTFGISRISLSSGEPGSAAKRSRLSAPEHAAGGSSRGLVGLGIGIGEADGDDAGFHR